MRLISGIITGIILLTGGCVSDSNYDVEKASKEEVEKKEIILLKKPSGPYGLGTVSAIWTDSTREEISTPSREDVRQLYIQIWYPAVHQSKGMISNYLGQSENVEELRNIIGSEWYELLQKVKPNSVLNAQLSEQKEKYPVVVFSPGFGASKYFYSSLLEEIASNGYIVVAIDHPFLNPLIDRSGHAIDPTNNYWHSFPAAGAANSFEEGVDRIRIANEFYSKDHLFVLDKLHELNGTDVRFKNRIDIEHVASVGHSAGTMAPMGLISRTESPFNVFILYDVNIHNYVAGENIFIPVTIETDAPIYLFILEYASIPPDDFVNQMRGDLHIARMAHSSHIGLMDFNFIQSQEEGNIHGIEIVNSELNTLFSNTLQFLDANLQ
jgi:hypothetical protein